MKPSQLKEFRELRDKHAEIADESAALATKAINCNGEARTMKCPCCGCMAVSQDVDSPYICSNCGWDSSKPNGGLDEV